MPDLERGDRRSARGPRTVGFRSREATWPRFSKSDMTSPGYPFVWAVRLTICSFLLLVAVVYNNLEGWKTQNKGGRPLVREAQAALPQAQRRMRKSKLFEDHAKVKPDKVSPNGSVFLSHGADLRRQARASNASAPSKASAATNTTLEEMNLQWLHILRGHILREHSAKSRVLQTPWDRSEA